MASHAKSRIHPARPTEERQSLKLSEASQALLDECRMVLPGVQALFGFQLIAVFNDRFAKELPHFEQVLHLVAIALVAVAVAMLMAPAAYHRSHGSREVTDTFIHVSSVLLLASMVPLSLGLSLDLYVIAWLVLEHKAVAVACAALVFAVILFFWFAFPRMHSLHSALASGREHAGHR